MFRTPTTPQDALPSEVIDALADHFNEHELAELAKLGKPVLVAAGTELTVEGTPGRQAVVVASGTASVLRDGRQIATVTPGDVVGEIALLTGDPRNATVVADTEALIYALSPVDFALLLSRCPRLSRRVTSTAVRRTVAA